MIGVVGETQPAVTRRGNPSSFESNITHQIMGPKANVGNRTATKRRMERGFKSRRVHHVMKVKKMDRASILGRLYLFVGEVRSIPQRKDFETDEDYEAAGEAWVAWQMTPETQPLDVADVDLFLSSFGWLVEQIQSMDETTLTDDEIMVPFYDAAKRAYGEDRSAIRRYFRYMYILLFRSESGPRWSQFIRAVGSDYFLRLVEERTSTVN